MTTSTRDAVTLTALNARLRTVDPSACLVESRILRRAIRYDAGISGVGLHAPHRKCHILNKKKIIECIEPEELGVSFEALQGEHIILIDAPDEEKLGAQTEASLLLRTWRLLFHAHVHSTLDALIEVGQLTPAMIRSRIHDLGRVEFDEIRAVLGEEEMLLPGHNDAHVYIEFAAVYLELRYFAPEMLTRYFPTFASLDPVDVMLARDVDATAIFERTYLKGSPKPAARAPIPKRQRLSSVQLPAVGAEHDEEMLSSEALIQAAEAALVKGNAVRAILSFNRAARAARSDAERGPLQARAREALAALSSKLPEGLNFHDVDATSWFEALRPLLPRARSIASPESRLLYDLQRACHDRTHKLETIDVAGWVSSLGRRGWRRHLSSLQPVLACKHLRKARGLLSKVRVHGPEREVLTQLLRLSVGHIERVLRTQFRPRIEQALQDADITPKNLPERVARDKLVEELLDRIVSRGFLTMGELRDTIAKSNLKLADFKNATDFLRGDALIRINRQLEVVLDGVYRGGEIYMRGLQRFSAAAFGTSFGRLLVLWCILPFLSSFVALEGLQHLLGFLIQWTTGVEVHLLTPLTFGVVGVWLLGIINIPAVRRASLSGIRHVGRGFRFVLYDAPAALFNLPLVLKIRRSAPYLWFLQRLLSPAAIAALLCAPLPLLTSWGASYVIAGSLAVTLSLLFSTRMGTQLQEVAADYTVRSWRRLSHRLIPGMLRWLIDASRRMLARVDQWLYLVDERLRFREGDGKLSVAFKAAFGVVWFAITYLIRLYINLLVEPQINPVKHFPVVTVSHKVILPMSPKLTSLFMSMLVPVLGGVVGGTLALATVLLLPGVFGFLAWELKENWRLFEANRSPDLEPVMIGSHGEKMTQLLKPGFHSGTLPKLYAKLRRAERRALATGKTRGVHKLREQLHHVEEDLCRYVERELLRLLSLHEGWTHPLEIGHIQIASNRVMIELLSGDDAPAWLSFAERGRWLIASLKTPGWLDALDDDDRLRWRVALAGFYKMCAVELVSEQITAQTHGSSVDISDEGLTVWVGESFNSSYVYPLSDGGDTLTPLTTGLRSDDVTPPALKTDDLIFSRASVQWRAWVDFWDGAEETEVAANVTLLPPA